MADPVLKTAMAEINAILMKHDIAGHVALVSQTHSEFLGKLDPSWTAVTVEGDFLRIRAKEAELGSKEAVRQRVEATAHVLCQIRDLTAAGFTMADKLIKKLEETHPIEHESYKGFEPHREN